MRAMHGRRTLTGVTLAMLVTAVLLLGAGGIGGARAALTAFSDTYDTRVSTANIGVALLENDEAVSWRTYASDGAWNEGAGMLLAGLVPEGESVHVGQRYPEALQVQNTGTVGQYVRVTLRRYWTDAEGEKQQTVWPGLIELAGLPGNGWVQDENATTDERLVFYYTSPVAPGEVTPALMDGLSVSALAQTKVTESAEAVEGTTVITTTYDYDGLRVNLEAQVDAIQEHNAADAALSAWGRAVVIDGTTLSLA